MLPTAAVALAPPPLFPFSLVSRGPLAGLACFGAGGATATFPPSAVHRRRRRRLRTRPRGHSGMATLSPDSTSPLTFVAPGPRLEAPSAF